MFGLRTLGDKASVCTRTRTPCNVGLANRCFLRYTDVDSVGSLFGSIRGPSSAPHILWPTTAVRCARSWLRLCSSAVSAVPSATISATVPASTTISATISATISGTATVFQPLSYRIGSVCYELGPPGQFVWLYDTRWPSGGRYRQLIFSYVTAAFFGGMSVNIFRSGTSKTNAMSYCLLGGTVSFSSIQLISNSSETSMR